MRLKEAPPGRPALRCTPPSAAPTAPNHHKPPQPCHRPCSSHALGKFQPSAQALASGQWCWKDAQRPETLRDHSNERSQSSASWHMRLAPCNLPDSVPASSPSRLSSFIVKNYRLMSSTTVEWTSAGSWQEVERGRHSRTGGNRLEQQYRRAAATADLRVLRRAIDVAPFGRYARNRDFS